MTRHRPGVNFSLRCKRPSAPSLAAAPRTQPSFAEISSEDEEEDDGEGGPSVPLLQLW